MSVITKLGLLEIGVGAGFMGIDKLCKQPINEETLQNNQAIISDAGIVSGILTAGYVLVTNMGK